MKYKLLLFILLLAPGFFACDLDEELRDDITYDQATQVANVNALLLSAYNGLQDAYINPDNVWALSEHTTDEAIPPTRASDWDDNGAWRVLKTHTWDAESVRVGGSFNAVLRVVFNATNVLNFKPSASQAAEARFLRAFAMFTAADLWDQVPYRDPGEDLLKPPKVLTGTQAVDFVISEMTAVINDLPDGPPANPAYKANKDAGRVLLMKAYLHKGAFANRTSPTFAAADMQQVITLADQIIGRGTYALATNYYDNFAVTNNVVSKELIFTMEQGPTKAGVAGNNVRSRWYSTLHYNQNPSGWNGFTTLSDFYDKFEASDKRRGDTYTGVTDQTGVRLGFMLGQQFDQNNTALQTRNGLPLSFTREVKLIETGANLELTGIRVLKYAPDRGHGDNPENDYVFYRYADVLLMKAEALLRSGGSASVARDLVNQVRTIRGASALGSVTLNNVYDERGRELYWESSRRQDMIRFGRFLAPSQEKPTTSGPERLVFPIPATALAVNPNLKQNPGY